MKKQLLIIGLTTLVFTLLVTQIFAQSPSISGALLRNTDNHNLPFFEGWDSGDFAANQWTNNSNWIIDSNIGNPMPSVKFNNTPLLTNYSSTLESFPIDAEVPLVGTIILQFDYKLDDSLATGTEYMDLRIVTDTDTVTVFAIHNIGSHDWVTSTKNITQYVAGKTFKLLFNAFGMSTANISGWYFDNIEIYSSCDRPSRLTGEQYWNNENDWGGEIGWRAPSSVFVSGSWNGWCSYDNSSGVGLTAGGDFSVATRWDEGMLDNYEGALIKSVRLFPVESCFDYLILKIYEGENATNTLYTDTIADIEYGEWNEYAVDDTIIIETSIEYWVGYDIIGQESNCFPAGCDFGPALDGYGDMIKVMGSPQWDSLSGLGLDKNWNIEMFLGSGPSQNPETLLGFSLSRKINNDNIYYPLDFIEFGDTQKNYIYQDSRPDLQGVDNAYYKVSCLWGNQGDTCISDYAPAWEIPMNDFVWLQYITKVNEKIDQVSPCLFPNPALSIINISAPSCIKSLIIMDCFGRIVHQKESHKSDFMSINISDFNPGVYTITIETNITVYDKKFVKL